ncbi:MAG: Stp1/IreP family PP2C-type Ser/Thr phosphatase [Tissierellia bacterium]|nr:Stp1/IreP family PP2C-type Ser/Thr phosphatase [Tissierellia bacterium]
MNIGVKTSKGRIREINQDFYYISADSKYPLFIIADGMGGHKAGEVASKMAVEIIGSTLEKEMNNLKLEDEYIVKIIKRSIWKANEEIYKRSLEREECFGMGTTVTLAWDIKEKIYIGHVGDSRAYLLRNNELYQITEDHSLVEELIKNGSISREEAKNHPQKNVITRAVGTSREIHVDVIIKEKNKGDILLLCTDGLTNMLNDDEIKELLLDDDMQRACENLVDLSNDKGGFDNISVVAIKYM